ncbi:hypothetical protein QFZ20_003067 [Flavobacterium sp. W4I14]|nr:hypothetical protein [Flavobacterium sp. W4I14]
MAYMREAGTARDSSAGIPQAAMRGGDLELQQNGVRFLYSTKHTKI